jgi:glycerol-3-phosphate responsive antiterminator
MSQTVHARHELQQAKEQFANRVVEIKEKYKVEIIDGEVVEQEEEVNEPLVDTSISVSAPESTSGDGE